MKYVEEKIIRFRFHRGKPTCSEMCIFSKQQRLYGIRCIKFKGDPKTKSAEAFTKLDAVAIALTRAVGFATRSRRRL